MTPPRDPRPWSVYILELASGAWYTGIATDVDARYRAHAAGRGARAVRLGGGPQRLVWQQGELSHTDALRLEHAIKTLRRSQKVALVRGDRDWRALLPDN
ncbi:MAG: GIY-YIG nuclease family protein [Pseudomonadota bacterium]